MRSAIGTALALGLVVVSCGAPSEGEGGDSTSVSSLPPGEITQLDDLCAQAAENIGEGHPSAAAEPMEQIGRLVADSSEGEDIRSAVDDISAILTEDPSGELADDQFRRMAPLVNELSARLYTLGATNCPALEEAVSAHLSPPPSDSEEVRDSAEQHRKLWRAEGIDTYHFVFSSHMEESLPEGTEPDCGVSGWILVQVVDGAPEFAVDRFSGCEIDPEPAQQAGLPLTVEDLFDLVIAHSDADQVQVDYEPSLGYPQTVFVQGDGLVVDLSIQELEKGRADLAGPETVLGDLEEHRQLWATDDIGDYTLTVQVDCFCPPEFRGPFTVSIENGEIAQATFQNDPIEEEVDRRFLTVEGLFGFVERNAYADQIEVTYHPELGYPEVIDVDPVRQAIDDEIQVSVLDFTAP